MKLLPLALLCSAICLTSPTYANPPAPVALPTGGQVVAGAASISSGTGSSLMITQSSNTAIVNWNTFNIGSSGSVTFAQPSASSTVLNRVLGDPTAIHGRLSSNGRVWLVNPGGTLVGSRTGRININTLVAPRQFSPSSAPSQPPALTAASLPPRATPAITAPANPGRMVDGSITLRMPLVDASPILFR
ncbi:MAG: filamentous hemagglutinin N-terminal domain-containing protein [Sulfuritalea sp.]|nr:filamentous hemagglutinin N-terminal domain-containing protein [Sulfuritalea sp.]